MSKTINISDQMMMHQRTSKGLQKLMGLLKGGEGSGNFGHSGRPGEVGGSAGEGNGAGNETRVQQLLKEAKGSLEYAQGYANSKTYDRVPLVMEHSIRTLRQAAQHSMALGHDPKQLTTADQKITQAEDHFATYKGDRVNRVKIMREAIQTAQQAYLQIKAASSVAKRNNPDIVLED